MVKIYGVCFGVAGEIGQQERSFNSEIHTCPSHGNGPSIPGVAIEQEQATTIMMIIMIKLKQHDQMNEQ